MNWIVETESDIKSQFDEKAVECGIRDSYEKVSSQLNYHLTQKLVENKAALEILKEAGDDGVQGWRLINKEYLRLRRFIA